MRIDGKILCIVLFLMLWYWKKTTFMYQWSIEYIHFLLRFKTIGERLVANFVSSSLKKRLLCLVFIRKRFSFTQVFQNYEMIKKDKWRNDIWKRAVILPFWFIPLSQEWKRYSRCLLKEDVTEFMLYVFELSELLPVHCTIDLTLWKFPNYFFEAQLKKHLLEPYSKTRSKL